MKIELNKTYKTRNGQTVIINGFNDNDNNCDYPFKGYNTDIHISYNYSSFGEYIKDVEHDYDLVLLIEDQPAQVFPPIFSTLTSSPVSKTIPKNANSQQVGGTHYKHKAIQPWDFISANNIGFLAGNVIKYTSRYKDKNGIEDLIKARHYLDKLIEAERLEHEQNKDF